jgi:diguanylate cyclase (GGDEF)-like protein
MLERRELLRSARASVAPGKEETFMRSVSAIETLIVLVVLHLLNLAFFQDDPGYLAIHPHPYFALITLSSLRYPRLASLGSTALVALALFLQTYFAPGGHFTTHSPEVVKYVVLFLITNLVLGELGSMFYREIEESRSEFEEMEKAHTLLNAQYEALQLVKDELSERIVGQTSSILSVYEAAKRLESLDEDQIHSALLEITAKFIGVDSCSLFLVDEDTLQAKMEKRYGWTVEDKARCGTPRFDLGKGIVGRVVEENRMLTLKELSSERSLIDAARETPLETVLAAPLANDNKVEAVINVEKIPFLKYSPTNIRLFYLIADLGSTALANSRRFSRMKKENIVDVETGLATLAFLETTMKAELQRYRRAGMEFCFCLMKIENEARLRSILGGKWERLEAQVARLAISCKREIDVAANLPTGEMAFLLPITGIEGALVFIRKIQKKVLGKIKVKADGRELRPTASFGLTVSQGQAPTTESILKRAKRALQIALDEETPSIHVDAGDGIDGGDSFG